MLEISLEGQAELAARLAALPDELRDALAEKADALAQKLLAQVVGVNLSGGVLNARSLVGVRGAGHAFDGLYYVKSVTHKIKRGEYKQSFTLTRNGLVSTVPTVNP